MFFQSWSSLAATAITGVSAYIALIVTLRLSGKRTLAKMNAFDFVVTVALGSTLATVLLSKDVPLAEGVLAFALLIALQFAVAWLLNNRIVTAPIAGPRTEAQWNDYLGSLDYVFTAADEALVNRLVVPGHASTPGYNDPAYPLEGRIARSG